MSRTLILSDTHLGSPRAGSALSADALRPLWQGFDRLVLNGDVAEIHHPKLRVRAVQEASRLLELCEEDGVEPTLISGNHDPFVGAKRVLFMADGQVLITHGDTFHPAVAPWSREAGVLKQELHEVMASLPTPGRRLDDKLTAAEHAHLKHWMESDPEAGELKLSHALLKPWIPLQVFYHWWRYPTLAARFARQHAPAARFLIFGHTHRGGIWFRDGVNVINTGCFGFPSRPRAVIIDDDTLEVRMVQRRGDGYALADAAVKRYALHLPDAQRPMTPRRRRSDWQPTAGGTGASGAPLLAGTAGAAAVIPAGSAGKGAA